MDKFCGTCYYGSGESELIFCLHEAHPGMAKQRNDTCDYWKAAAKKKSYRQPTTPQQETAVGDSEEP